MADVGAAMRQRRDRAVDDRPCDDLTLRRGFVQGLAIPSKHFTNGILEGTEEGQRQKAHDGARVWADLGRERARDASVSNSGLVALLHVAYGGKASVSHRSVGTVPTAQRHLHETHRQQHVEHWT